MSWNDRCEVFFSEYVSNEDAFVEDELNRKEEAPLPWASVLSDVSVPPLSLQISVS